MQYVAALLRLILPPRFYAAAPRFAAPTPRCPREFPPGAQRHGPVEFAGKGDFIADLGGASIAIQASGAWGSTSRRRKLRCRRAPAAALARCRAIRLSGSYSTISNPCRPPCPDKRHHSRLRASPGLILLSFGDDRRRGFFAPTDGA